MANRVVSVVMQAEIGSYVSGMAKAAAATKGVGETADRTARQSQRGFDLAGRGAVLFGAVAAGALVGVITKSAEFERAMSAVQAATGASVASLGELREAAIKAGADTQYSATEAANAITEMAKAGVSAKDILGGGLDGALALAAAGQLDVAEAAEIAATAMTQFSLSGSQLPHVADLLAAGAGKAMGSVDDLGQALNQAGLLASSTGISIEETTGTLAAFASAGLIGSDAGTSFKTMLQALQNPSKESAELLAQLGINAYDAQGNFVGLAGLAGQLQAKLGGLTQAQRDQALAQIFGTDAARAATVLYREGAAGIQEWTNKVNDAGYAQEQAAALTDNLTGDLERLGGSFDTLLISIGQGAQGPLRDLVQLLGGLVDGVGGAVKVFGDLPGPIQLSIAAAGAWAVAGGKIGGVFEGLRAKVQGFREEGELQRSLLASQQRTADEASASYGTLADRIDATTGVSRQLGDNFEVVGYKAATAKAAVAGFVRAIGPELAAAAAAYLLVDIAGDISEVANAGDDATEAIKRLKESINNADSNQARFDATSAGIDELRSKIADAKAVIQNFNDESVLHYAFIGQFQDEYTTDVADAKTSLELLQDALDETTHKQEVAAQAATDLGDYFHLSADEVVVLADKYGIDLTQGASSATGALAAALTTEQELARGTDAATTTADLFAQSLQDTADAADEAKKQTDLFKLSLDILTGAHISLAEAEAAMYAAFDAATGSLEGLTGAVLDNAGQLNVQTEAGRKAQETLFNIRDAGDQYIATLIEQGASTEDVIAADHDLRESFIRSAQQMNISREDAEKLADQILGIPSERETKITADTTDASNDVAGFQRQVDDLHGKTVTVTVLADRTDLANYAVQHGMQMVGGYADGGYTGPGAKYQYAGPAHKGEVIWSQDDVAAHGGPQRVDAMRRARGYADGGIAEIRVQPDSSDLGAAVTSMMDLMARSLVKVPTYSVGAGAEQWRSTVLQALSMLGLSASLASGVLAIISRESGGNPNAINLWDSNAAAGHPSRGLMQTIPTTFAAWRSPSLPNNIVDPLANIYAGINYAYHTYGTSMLAAGGRHTSGGAYMGYKTGTDYVPQDGLAYLHQGEAVVPADMNPRSREFSGGGGFSGSGRSDVVVNARVFVGDREITDIVRVEAEAVVDGKMAGANRRFAAAGVR